MNKKSTALAKAPSEDVLKALANYFPVDPGFTNVSLPRIRFVSQDITEETGVGRNKSIKVVVPAGTFFREEQTDDVDEESGKNIWSEEELGEEIDLQIIFQRKQLKYYDKDTNSFVSSNVYDDPEEVVKLFANKGEIASGTPAELKKNYEAEDKRTGKVKSLLEDTRILYVLLNGVLHQLNLRGTSMYAWLTYARSVRPSAPAVITHLGSSPQENGSTKWNRIDFTVDRPASAEEAEKAVEQIQELSQGIEDRKARNASSAAADKEFNDYGKDRPALGAGK